MPSLFLVFCLICGLAIARLGPLLDRIEADKLARLQAAILRAPAPSSWRGFLSDLVGACLLSLLALISFVLAFTL